MVTSRDIARLAGVSQATVSRVLQDSPRVSPETRRRVLQVLEEMNFAPDARARAMVTKRTGNVGVVVDDITNPFYPEVVEALGRTLDERGLRMMLWDAVGAGEQGAVEAIRQRLVDGVVFTTATSSSTALANAAELGLPLVLFNRSVPDVDCDQVVSDNRAGGRLVADHLADLGHELSLIQI